MSIQCFRLRLLGFALCLVGVLAAHAIAEQSSAEYASELHDAFSKIRETEYGNVHLVLRYSVKGSSEYSSEKRISYWAKDGRKFRIDEEPSVCFSTFLRDRLQLRNLGQVEVPSKTRWVLRPEGFVTLGHTDNGLEVVNVGSNDDGRERLIVEDWYCASTRCYRIVDAEAPFGFSEDLVYTNGLSTIWAKALTPLDLLRNGDELKVTSQFELSRDGQKSRNLFEVKYDLANHVHTSFTQLGCDVNDAYKTLRVLKEYDFHALKHIPRSVIVEKEYGDDGWDSSQLTVEHVDWSPVPDEIFEAKAFLSD